MADCDFYFHLSGFFCLVPGFILEVDCLFSADICYLEYFFLGFYLCEDSMYYVFSILSDIYLCQYLTHS